MGWLAAVPYLVAIVLMLTVSTLSDKIQNRKRFVWPLLLIAGLAFTGSWLVGNDAFWLSYSLLIIAAACMYAPYGPFFALIPEMLPKSVAGVSMGLINSFGALGAFTGAWVVGLLNGLTGNPSLSFVLMAISLFISVAIMYSVKPQQAAAHTHA